MSDIDGGLVVTSGEEGEVRDQRRREQEPLSLSEDEDGAFDGPNIRPPQAAVSRDHRGSRQRSSGHRHRNDPHRNRPPRRDHRDADRRGDRKRGHERGGRREDRHERRAEDLRERLSRKHEDRRNRDRRPLDGRDRRDQRREERGRSRGRSVRDETEDDRRAREEKESRLKKLVSAAETKVQSKRDAEVRRQRKEVEKQMVEYEQKMKRKRDRSRSKERKKVKKGDEEENEEGEEEEEEEDEEESEDDSDESGEEEEESEEEESEEENSDTASERSEVTPVHEEESEEEGEEKEVEPEPVKAVRSISRTPSKSPTPRREDHDSVAGPLEQEGDDRSQGSFADGIPEGGEDLPDDTIEIEDAEKEEDPRDKLPPYLPSIYGCRSVEEFQCLNRIEEGTYGVVYRAKDKKTGEIVALKRLKMEREKEGFPITSLREINTLLISQHPNVVTVREIVVGSFMDKIFIVMDFVQHDLKSLMETMREKKQVFLPGEVKCLMLQLLKAVAHLHDNWILHRDLKSSNLLLSHNGILKVGDFGLAREYGSPLKQYTSIVVTLWYRAPELLLGIKEYSTPIDVWSIGCLFGEFLQMEPLFPGKSESDELNRIFKLLGTPSEKIWPGYNKLPVTQKTKFVDYPVSHLRNKFPVHMLSEQGLNLLKRFLTYDPKKRISCEDALNHEYFDETPRAIDPSMFPTWPAKSEMSASDKKKAASSPKPPSGGGAFKKLDDDDDKMAGFSFVQRNQTSFMPQWNLKF